MNAARESIWQALLARALAILDDAVAHGMPDDWSFGGGTVLMLRHRHRFSKDIDIFVPDEQCLGFLTPRLNDRAETGMTDYVEQRGSIKIYYPEGEVDFVAAAALMPAPFEESEILGRRLKVERSEEIVGKKVLYRAREFKARDIFDLALVLEREPAATAALLPLLRAKGAALLERLARHDAALREDFEQIDALDYRPDYEYCRELIRHTLGKP